jgi:hypothetical protein
MAQKKICLLSPYEAQDLMLGRPIDHRHHEHVDDDRAKLLVFGADQVPWLDKDYLADMKSKDTRRQRSARFSERHSQEVETLNGKTERRGAAVWATLPSGEKSSRHLELEQARTWQGGQWLPLGTLKQGIKRTRTHLRKPIQYALTQCFDTNHGDRPSV